jgi:hypothetical protein
MMQVCMGLFLENMNMIGKEEKDAKKEINERNK